MNLRLILQSLCAEPFIFFCDMTMLLYFNMIINIIVAIEPTFIRVLKILIVLFSYHKCFVKTLFQHVNQILTFSDHINYKFVNCIFIQVSFKRITRFISNTYSKYYPNLLRQNLKIQYIQEMAPFFKFQILHLNTQYQC